MEKLKQIPAAPKRLICFLLALICMLGLLPNTAFAAGPNTIVMEDCTHNGVYYESAALSTCWLHQMKFDFNGDTVMGFCADHGGGMGWSLEGHEWNNPREITDPTVKTMMAYFYAHSRGIFTDQAKALGVDETWSSDYTWTMNAWVQAVVWRYQENLFSDPVAACAEELMYVYNNLEHTSYSSIDDVVDGTTLRDRAQYILDLGAQGVWGDCTVYEYDYAGPGTAQHPAYDVQGIIIGDLTVTRERYQFTIKKVDATNPNLALPGARFLVQNANGTFEKEVVTGRDGTVTLTNLEASTYSVTELDPPEDYQIDNPGPQYVAIIILLRQHIHINPSPGTMNRKLPLAPLQRIPNLPHKSILKNPPVLPLHTDFRIFNQKCLKNHFSSSVSAAVPSRPSIIPKNLPSGP